MGPRWRASVLAAAGAAMLLAGCGIRVATEPSPAPARTATMVAATPASPAASPSAGAPSATPAPLPVSPVPSASADALRRPSCRRRPRPPPAPATRPAPRAAALAAAARRVAAAAAVRRAVPAFDQLAAEHGGAQRRARARPWPSSPETRPCTARCFGLREIGRPDQVDDDTLFQLGGVSQAYTTTLLAALAGEGELRWDEPVRRVWPGVPAARPLGVSRGHVPGPHGGAQRPAGVCRQRAARVRLRARRDPAAAALSPPGGRLPRRVRASGRAGHGGGHRRGARHRRRLGAPPARARAASRSGTTAR